MRKKKMIDKVFDTEDVNTLRGYLLEVEAEIKKIVGDDPCYYFISYPKERELDRIEDLIGTRYYILNKMFTYTKEEISRIETVNDLLFKLTKQMFKRTGNLYRTVLRDRDADFDDDYDVEGWLMTEVAYDCEGGNFGTVLQLDNDDYYGSDFPYMICVCQELCDVSHSFGLKHIHECYVYHCNKNNPEMLDQELECDYTRLDDGDTWNECLWRPDLNHICFCYAFHSIYTHLYFPLADIIRINRYWVEAQIRCQRITDYRGRRLLEIDPHRFD